MELWYFTDVLKNKDTFLNPKYSSLGWWAMPNILIFQYIIPLFSPLADILMIFGLLPEKSAHFYIT